MWRAVWELWDRRTHPIAVKKVKAHQKKNGNIEEDVHCEGNSHADAAAKAGLEMHPIDMTAVNLARKVRAIQKLVAKFLVYMQLAVASAGDDCIKLDRRFKPKKQDKSGDAATPSSPCIKESTLRHAAVQTCSGVRCIWCNVGAKNKIALARHPCVQAPNHTLWNSKDLVMCSRCGAYASRRTKKLKDDCRGEPDRHSKERMKRFFERHLHPFSLEPIDPPKLWYIAAGRQERDEQIPSVSQARPDSRTAEVDERYISTAERFGHRGDYKSFRYPEPDEHRFRLAVLNRTAAEDSMMENPPATTTAPNNRCIGAATDGKDALAGCIGSGAQIRRRFRINGKRPETEDRTVTGCCCPECL